MAILLGVVAESRCARSMRMRGPERTRQWRGDRGQARDDKDSTADRGIEGGSSLRGQAPPGGDRSRRPTLASSGPDSAYPERVWPTALPLCVNALGEASF